jgi:hypothetical protein
MIGLRRSNIFYFWRKIIMKKSIFLLLTLALILAIVPAGMAKKPAPKLECTTDYWWMGDHWEGAINGGINGDIVWPGGGAMRPAGQTTHYGGGFEIYVNGVLVMTGEHNVGSTTIRHGRDSIWRVHGTVIWALPGSGFENWVGRQVYQAGHFTWDSPGVPLDGYGVFRIN